MSMSELLKNLPLENLPLENLMSSLAVGVHEDINKFIETYSIEPNTLFIDKFLFAKLTREVKLRPNHFQEKCKETEHLTFMNLQIFLFDSKSNPPNFCVGVI